MAFEDFDHNRGSAKVQTIWELHPVYAIDVCKFDTIKKCSAKNEDAWTPLDQWEEPEKE